MRRINKYTGLIIILLLLIAQSCNKTSRSGIRKSEVIPEEEMVDILSDLYLVDGLLNYPPIRTDYENKDSTENYTDIISEYGYTKEDVDQSIKYYFIDKPKKYASIYDRVIEKLSGMEADVIQKMSQDTNLNQNLWNGERSYSLPDYGLNDPLEFSIRTEGLGEYVIKARITLYEDDQSIDPHCLVWFWFDDGSEEGKKIMWDREDLVKTGRPVVVTMRNELNDPRVTHLRGRLLNHADQTGHWEKHAMVSSITVNRRDETQMILPPG